MGAVDRLKSAQRAAARMAQADLRKFWQLYGNLPAGQLKEALMTAMPALTRKHGGVMAAAAADWYEETLLAATGKAQRALLADIGIDAIEASTRWAVDDLYHGDPADTWRKLEQSLLRNTKNAARETIRRNAERDGYAYARVPSGQKTCAFCTMLSSRGFVYGSAERAGALDRFHDDCNCQIVPDFAMDAKERTAYDQQVDVMYQQYMNGRIAAGYGDAVPAGVEGEILAAMRLVNPGAFTDSPQLRTVILPDEVAWKHIMFGDADGGGHLYGSTAVGKSQFPSGWNKARIEAAIQQTQLGGKQRTGDGVRKYEMLVDDVLVRVVVKGEKVATAYPLRGVGVARLTAEGMKPVPLQSRDAKRYNRGHGRQ